MIKSTYEIAQRHWSLMHHNKWYIAWRYITKILGSISSILAYVISPAMIVKYLTALDKENTILWIFLLFIFYLCYLVSYYFNYWIDGRDNNYVYCGLKDRIFNSLLKYDLDYHQNLTTSTIINTTATDVWNISSINGNIVDITITYITVIGMLGIIFCENIWIGVLSTIIIYTYMKSVSYVNDNAIRHLRTQRKFQDRITGMLSEVMDGKLEIQIYDMFSKLQTRFQKLKNKFKLAYQRKRFFITLRYSLFRLIYELGKVGLYVVMLIYVFQGKFTIDKIILIIGYYDLMIYDVEYLSNCFQNLKTNEVAVDRVGEVINYQRNQHLSFGENEQDDIFGVVKFSKVYFGYKDVKTLRNVSLTFEQNKVSAIVGKSGSGKSTILNLLLRLYQPEKGEITLDGIPIQDYSKAVYFSNVSVVNQRPFVFHMTIQQNLSLVDPNKQRQIDACKRVGIHDIIMNLPKGYSTVLTENGSELSAGEKQLLSLARTLLSKAEVLLFDEITSALDAKTTKHIASLLADLKKDHTIIMITHKPEMMEKADQIAVLHKGKIVGVGDHKSLLKENEYYQQLQLRENESSFQSV